MKKIFAMAVACMMAGAAMAEGSAEFKKGDFLVNVGVGVGTHGDEGTGPATFTQQASFEYALCNIGKKSTLSIGFMASNSWGDFGDVTLTGTYDYYYTERTHSHLRNYSYHSMRSYTYEDKYTTSEYHREGTGTADAEYSYDDIKLLPTLSYHCQVTPSLDMYATLGIGVAVMNKLISNMHNYQGFKSESVYNDRTPGPYHDEYFEHSYSYEDKAHAEFEDGAFHRASAAFVFKVGARYYFNQHWGMFGEFGLTAVTLKSATPKSWELLTAGATYKF